MSKDIKNFITWIRTFLDDVYANTTHTHSTTEVADPNAHSDIGTSADATQTDINTAINTSISNKAPKSHRSTSTTYGIGSTTYYGHCKIRNNLTDNTYSTGYVLSSYQGYLLNESINTKQDILVSGTNIKTINNESIVGSGNLEVGSTITVDDTISNISTNPVQNKKIYEFEEEILDEIGDKFSTTGGVTPISNDWLDSVYPVGSIYMSINNTNPSTLIGGTWEKIEDRFLLASGNSYTSGSTGGEANHTLTINEMPSHTHKQNQWSIIVSSGGNTGTNGLPSGTLVNSIKDDRQSNTRITEGAGSDNAHNNMPPYLVVNVWYRIR